MSNFQFEPKTRDLRTFVLRKNKLSNLRQMLSAKSSNFIIQLKSLAYLGVFDFVKARDIPRIDSGKIRRLYPAGPPVAARKYPVAVSTLDQISSPDGNC